MQDRVWRTSPEYYRNRRARFKAQGLCTMCGKVEPEYESATCRDCKSKYRSQRDMGLKMKRQRELRRHRVQNGLCSQCNTPAIPGTAQCERHKEIKDRYNAKKKAAKAKRLANVVDYKPPVQPVVVQVDGHQPWFLSFDYETTPTVFEMGVGQ